MKQIPSSPHSSPSRFGLKTYTPRLKANGHAFTTGSGTFKRRRIDVVDTRPSKKRTVYMDSSDDEFPRKPNGGGPNGASPPRKSPSKNGQKKEKYVALQEQRKQLPIAQGSFKKLFG